MLDGEHLGCIYAGDYLDADRRADQVQQIANYCRGLGIGTDYDITPDIEDLPVLSGSEESLLIDLMEMIADYFADSLAPKRHLRAGGQAVVAGMENPFIVGNSDKVTQMLETIAKVAKSQASILITGESGVGKELVANTVHVNSARANRKFIAVNCGAFHEGTLESELFGHVKGAFTDATTDREGFFSKADGGTLFLDEIGETSLATQVRMLRFLQEGTFVPVGSAKEMKSDVRIVAATNRDLRRMIKQGKFREDLYYRLRVIQVHVPSLRERSSDIQSLVDHFLEKHRLDDGDPPALTDAAKQALTAYPWPGNIRQLENEVKRLIVLAGRGATTIDSDLVSAEIREHERQTMRIARVDDKLRANLENKERREIREGLKKFDGNKSRLARHLGMSRTKLLNKIKKYGITYTSDE